MDEVHIKDVEVQGLACLGEQSKLTLTFARRLMIFPGRNGTGKTSIANSLRATLCGETDPAGYGTSKMKSYINDAYKSKEPAYAKTTFNNGSARTWQPANGIIDHHTEAGQVPRAFSPASCGIDDPLLFTKNSEAHPYWARIFKSSVTGDEIIQYATEQLKANVSTNRYAKIEPVMNLIIHEERQGKKADLSYAIKRFNEVAGTSLRAGRKMMEHVEDMEAQCQPDASAKRDALLKELQDLQDKLTGLEAIMGVAAEQKNVVLTQAQEEVSFREQALQEFNNLHPDDGAELVKQARINEERIQELQERVYAQQRNLPPDTTAVGTTYICPGCEIPLSLSGNELIKQPSVDEMEAQKQALADKRAEIEDIIRSLQANITEHTKLRDEAKTNFVEFNQSKQSFIDELNKAKADLEKAKQIKVASGDAGDQAQQRNDLIDQMRAREIELEPLNQAVARTELVKQLTDLAAKVWATEVLEYAASPKGAIASRNQEWADLLNKHIHRIYSIEGLEIRFPMPQMTMPNFIFEANGRSTKTLSGAERWFAKSAIQMAVGMLSKEPAVVVLDEADILDSKTLAQLWGILHRVVEKMPHINVVVFLSYTTEELMRTLKGTNYEDKILCQPLDV